MNKNKVFFPITQAVEIEVPEPSDAAVRALASDAYELPEPKDNRHNGPKTLAGKIGAALSRGFAMLSDDEDLNDVQHEGEFSYVIINP